jgi:hypothetical protein
MALGSTQPLIGIISIQIRDDPLKSVLSSRKGTSFF